VYGLGVILNGYVVEYQSENDVAPQVSDLLDPTTSSFDLTLLPTLKYTVLVRAVLAPNSFPGVSAPVSNGLTLSCPVFPEPPVLLLTSVDRETCTLSWLQARSSRGSPKIEKYCLCDGETVVWEGLEESSCVLLFDDIDKTLARSGRDNDTNNSNEDGSANILSHDTYLLSLSAVSKDFGVLCRSRSVRVTRPMGARALLLTATYEPRGEVAANNGEQQSLSAPGVLLLLLLLCVCVCVCCCLFFAHSILCSATRAYHSTVADGRPEQSASGQILLARVAPSP
jgi:hypothetical protein